jgi:hypothetical protein
MLSVYTRHHPDYKNAVEAYLEDAISGHRPRADFVRMFISAE